MKKKQEMEFAELKVRERTVRMDQISGDLWVVTAVFRGVTIFNQKCTKEKAKHAFDVWGKSALLAVTL